MQKIAKNQRRAIRQRVRNWRLLISTKSPALLKRTLGGPMQYADMLLVDHGLFRVLYLNCHRLGKDAWRSAQPAPHQIAQSARLGIKTIVNLRGPRVCGAYWLEQAACERHGIRLEDFQVRSRAAPSKEELRGARALFKRLEYPILLHCKSGADRAGLMSALYLIFHENVPVELARQQLAFRFGHIRQSDTGILDYFFESYLRDNAQKPQSFVDWIEHTYDPDALKESYTAKRWANLLTTTILRRE